MSNRESFQPRHESQPQLSEAHRRLMGNHALNPDHAGMFARIQPQESDQRPITNVPSALIDQFRQKAHSKAQAETAHFQAPPGPQVESSPKLKRLPDGSLQYGNYIKKPLPPHLRTVR